MSQSVAQADQLDKRSKELDAREAYIATREQLGEDNEVKIAKQQRELALLDDTIISREVILKDQTARMTAQDKEYISKGISLRVGSEREQEKLQKLQDKVLAATQELVGIRQSVQERETYYKDQETLITKQSEDGNLQLRGLEYEIIESKQVVKDLEVKKKNSYQEIRVLETDLDSVRQGFAPDLAAHEADVLVIVRRKESAESDVVVIQQTLHDLNKEVNRLLIKRQQIHADVDAKLILLDTKEREIMAKREALRQERKEMEEARHYHQDPKSLYGTI